MDVTNDSGSAYDTNVKHLLADKQILSRILKYTVGEFRNMDLTDIMDCIGNDIEIGTRPVDAGLSNLGRVKGTATEKKRILTDEYGMVMTAELEGRLQIICNLSENIEAKGVKEGIKEGIRKERIAAIERMIKAKAAKEQIILYGYTEEEYAEAENSMCLDA